MTVLAVLPAVDSTGILTYTLTNTLAGTSTFDVQVRDSGGIANGGVDTSAVQTFTLTVNHVSTTTNLTLQNTPSVFGEPVTFMATVLPTAPSSSTPSGSVTTAAPCC